MSTPPADWLFTGLHWESARPVLTGVSLPADPGSTAAERTRTAGPGAAISWSLHAPRRCTGTWTGTSRVLCPAAAELPIDGTDPQCPACAYADKGRQIARDAALGDDGREYMLYLAWFGHDLAKVGLTAADRGRDRLLEQGAIAYTPLATGPYTPIRQAERLASATGLARERISSRAKAAAWWTLPPAGERATLLAEVRDRIAGQVNWPGRIGLVPCTITDQAADFGIGQDTPGPYSEVTGISDHAVLCGQVRMVIGHHLLLDNDSGQLLADMRRVCGRTIRHGVSTASPDGLTLTFQSLPRAPREHQQELF